MKHPLWARRVLCAAELCFASFAATLTVVEAASSDEGANPIGKVLELLEKLQGEVIEAGEASQKTYDKLTELCEDRSQQLQREIKAGKEEEEQLKAKIEKASNQIEELSGKIEELGTKTYANEQDLRRATDIRTRERNTFEKTEKELLDTVDTLERAVGIIEKAMKGGSFVQDGQQGQGEGEGQASVEEQFKGAETVAQTLQVIVEAAGFGTFESDRLTSMLQNGADGDLEAEAEETGAPAAQAYQSKSGSLLTMLEDLLQRAHTELDEARQGELSSLNAYNLLKQGLEMKISFLNKQLGEAKTKKGEATERKSESEGMLAVLQKDLAGGIKALATLHRDCMGRAADFQEEVRSRAEELKAIAGAKKIIQEATGAATEAVYGAGAAAAVQFTFMQVGQHTSEPPDIQALHIVRQMAYDRKSEMFSQLASRMEVTIRNSQGSGDVFEKIREMIGGMIAKLTDQANAEAQQKAFCDKEMTETKLKSGDKTAEVAKLTSRIDILNADLAKLSGEIMILQEELVNLAKTQDTMSKIRSEEKAQYLKVKADMQEGIDGLQAALRTLRSYYQRTEEPGAGASQGAGASIISILELAESDFTKSLAESNAEEDAAAKQYEQQTQANSVLKVKKEQDVQYKTKAVKSAQKSISEFSNDREGAQTELDALNEYWSKLTEQCIAKAEPYEERKRRREEELAGLQEALQILEGGDALLLQVDQKETHSLRGVRRHVGAEKIRQRAASFNN